MSSSPLVDLSQGHAADTAPSTAGGANGCNRPRGGAGLSGDLARSADIGFAAKGPPKAAGSRPSVSCAHCLSSDLHGKALKCLYSSIDLHSLAPQQPRGPRLMFGGMSLGAAKPTNARFRSFALPGGFWTVRTRTGERVGAGGGGGKAGFWASNVANLGAPCALARRGTDLWLRSRSFCDSSSSLDDDHLQDGARSWPHAAGAGGGAGGAGGGGTGGGGTGGSGTRSPTEVLTPLP